MFNAQSFQANTQRRRVTTCDDHWRDAGVLEQFQTMTVQGAESFERFTLLRKVQTTVGQNAINVKEHHFDTLCLEQQFR